MKHTINNFDEGIHGLKWDFEVLNNTKLSHGHFRAESEWNFCEEFFFNRPLFLSGKKKPKVVKKSQSGKKKPFTRGENT